MGCFNKYMKTSIQYNNNIDKKIFPLIWIHLFIYTWFLVYER